MGDHQVIVVGAGQAGVAGSLALKDVGLVGIVLMRSPVRVADAFAKLAQRIDHGDLSEYGLPYPEEGLFTKYHRDGTVPTIVDPEVIGAIKARRIEVVAAVEDLDGSGARLAGGERLEPDAVVCATGYRRVLEPLVGHLGVLDERELPRAQGEKPAAPGLRFIGYTSRPGALGYMGKQARRAAKAIARELR